MFHSIAGPDPAWTRPGDGKVPLLTYDLEQSPCPTFVWHGLSKRIATLDLALYFSKSVSYTPDVPRSVVACIQRATLGIQTDNSTGEKNEDSGVC